MMMTGRRHFIVCRAACQWNRPSMFQPAKPLRIWMEVVDRDLLNPNVMRDNMHDWVRANKNMAKVLAAKGYHYQFVLARNAGHCDGGLKQQTLPEALEWLWKDYSAAAEPTAPAGEKTG